MVAVRSNGEFRVTVDRHNFGSHRGNAQIGRSIL
jgi:hypothetical protein